MMLNRCGVSRHRRFRERPLGGGRTHERDLQRLVWFQQVVSDYRNRDRRRVGSRRNRHAVAGNLVVLFPAASPVSSGPAAGNRVLDDHVRGAGTARVQVSPGSLHPNLPRRIPPRWRHSRSEHRQYAVADRRLCAGRRQHDVVGAFSSERLSVKVSSPSARESLVIATVIAVFGRTRPNVDVPSITGLP